MRLVEASGPIVRLPFRKLGPEDYCTPQVRLNIDKVGAGQIAPILEAEATRVRVGYTRCKLGMDKACLARFFRDLNGPTECVVCKENHDGARHRYKQAV